MGIGDFLRRRRERESALSPGGLEELSAPAETGAADEAGAGEAERSVTALPGADAGELGAMIRRAAETGLPQVSADRHEVDLRGTSLGNEIAAILAAFGINRGGSVPQLDSDQAADLNRQVREALRREGIDPESGRPL